MTTDTRPFTTRRESLLLDGQPIDVYVAQAMQPQGATVLMLSAIWSVTPHIESLCDRLAGLGIHAIAPCMFRGQGIPALDAAPDALARTFLSFDDRRCTRDLKALVHQLARGEFGFDAGPIVPWGFCLGGRFAHYLGAMTNEVAGLVNFYGRMRFERQPIKPFLPIELAGLIQVPYLGHFAEIDALIPAADVDALKVALTEQRTPHAIHVYPRVRHAFFDSSRPADHDAQASSIAWTRSVDLVRSLATTHRPVHIPSKEFP